MTKVKNRPVDKSFEVNLAHYQAVSGTEDEQQTSVMMCEAIQTSRATHCSCLRGTAAMPVGWAAEGVGIARGREEGFGQGDHNLGIA